MKETYDLTTKEGIKSSLNYVKHNPDVIFNPLGHFLIKGVQSLLNTKEKVEKQTQIALEIIEKGKKEGVKSMNIKVSEQAGMDIQSSMKEFPLKCKIGSDGNMEIEVEYK
jgi:hypothetical protein